MRSAELKEIRDELDEYKNKMIFIVGGVAVNEEWIKDTGADFGTNNAISGLKIINNIIKNI